MNYLNSMLEAIGHTPLLKLNRLGRGLPGNIFVKLEYLNPSGSYKDRMALAMIEAAERGDTWNGKRLRSGGTVCEASAGNTAPAVAFVAALKGCKARLTVYAPMLRGESTRLKIIAAFGPEVAASRPPSEFLKPEELDRFLAADHDLTYIVAGKAEAARREIDDPDTVWLDQIYNPYNYIGQKAIGYEIHEQLEGRVDAWGCAVGSGATLYGTALALAEKGVKPLTFGVVPTGSEVYMELDKAEAGRGEFRRSRLMEELAGAMKLTKWQQEKAIVERMLDDGYPDRFFRIGSAEAREVAHRLSAEEGIFCGMSSGANVAVALKLAARMPKDSNIVTVIVDRRDRYLGEFPEEVFIV